MPAVISAFTKCKVIDLIVREKHCYLRRYSRLFSPKMKIKAFSLPGLRGGCNKVKIHYFPARSWRNVCLWLVLSCTKKWLCLLDIYLYPPVLSGPKVGLRILDLRRTLLVWNARLSALCNDTGTSNFVNHSRHVHTRLYLLGHFLHQIRSDDIDRSNRSTLTTTLEARR